MCVCYFSLSAVAVIWRQRDRPILRQRLLNASHSVDNASSAHPLTRCVNDSNHACLLKADSLTLHQLSVKICIKFWSYQLAELCSRGLKANTRYGISRKRSIRSTLCLVLAQSFRGRRIEWRYFRFDKIQDGGWRPSWIYTNGRNIATCLPIDVMFGCTVGFLTA